MPYQHYISNPPLKLVKENRSFTHLHFFNADAQTQQARVLARIGLHPSLDQRLHTTKAGRRDEVAEPVWEEDGLFLIRSL
jgi:hypothetical protein